MPGLVEMAAGWSARRASSSFSGNLVICRCRAWAMGDLIELLEYHWCVDQLLVLDPRSQLVGGGRMVSVEGFSSSSKAI